MVAGEQQPVGAVGEDVVARRVAGRVDGVDGPAADLDRDVAVEPGVGIGPVDRVGQVFDPAAELPGLGDLGRAGRPQHPGERVAATELAPAGCVEQVQPRLLEEPERHIGAVLVTEDGRQREVVAVDVGDQEPPDVAEAGADRAQALVEQLAGDRDRPPAVDQGHPSSLWTT